MAGRTQNAVPRQGENSLATLRRVPLFNELSQTELALIAERAVRRKFSPGALIFAEGGACQELLVVEEGSVRLFKTAASGRQQLIGIERAGNTLAEVPLFDGGRHSATASAIAATTLLSLDAEQFRRVCQRHPAVAMKVIKVLGHRLRHLDSLVEELSFSTVRGRLVAYLLRLARETGRHEGSAVEFSLKENNEELAARFGTVRELVSRNLGRLHGDGLIEMSKRKVRIVDLKKLELEAATEARG